MNKLSAQLKLQSWSGSCYTTPIGRCFERSQKGYQLSTMLQCTSAKLALSQYALLGINLVFKLGTEGNEDLKMVFFFQPNFCRLDWGVLEKDSFLKWANNLNSIQTFIFFPVVQKTIKFSQKRKKEKKKKRKKKKQKWLVNFWVSE